MPDDLYDRDILIWAERQADLLRRLAQGERVNESVDWPHVIEEVQDVGLSELHSCESLLEQAMVHLLKMHLIAGGPVEHWRSEVVGFLGNAKRRFAPSMRQRIDLGEIYDLARDQAVAALREGEGVRELPESCPWSLDELLAKKASAAQLAAKLA